MKLDLAPKHWAILAVSILALTVILFNDSFRQTISRRRAARQTQAEIEAIAAEVELLKHKIAELEKNPQAKENLVRRELGYLRPGEKEIRFMPKKGSDGKDHIR